jgi:hypothetical protein
MFPWNVQVVGYPKPEIILKITDFFSVIKMQDQLLEGKLTVVPLI